jgi:hypothetical protein
MTPQTFRFSQPMMREIEAIQTARALEQPDFGKIVRELCAEALAARSKRK